MFIFTNGLSGLPFHHTEKVDRRERLHLKYITNNRNDFGKQIKCSAKNHLGNDVDYAEIPGNILGYIEAVTKIPF